MWTRPDTRNLGLRDACDINNHTPVAINPPYRYFGRALRYPNDKAFIALSRLIPTSLTNLDISRQIQNVIAKFSCEVASDGGRVVGLMQRHRIPQNATTRFSVAGR
jgi:hypothetical protein